MKAWLVVEAVVNSDGSSSILLSPTPNGAGVYRADTAKEAAFEYLRLHEEAESCLVLPLPGAPTFYRRELRVVRSPARGDQ